MERPLVGLRSKTFATHVRQMPQETEVQALPRPRPFFKLHLEVLRYLRHDLCNYCPEEKRASSANRPKRTRTNLERNEIGLGRFLLRVRWRRKDVQEQSHLAGILRSGWQKGHDRTVFKIRECLLHRLPKSLGIQTLQ
jgi:hypothetical protein